jgi:hypothetical protein
LRSAVQRTDTTTCFHSDLEWFAGSTGATLGPRQLEIRGQNGWFDERILFRTGAHPMMAWNQMLFEPHVAHARAAHRRRSTLAI